MWSVFALAPTSHPLNSFVPPLPTGYYLSDGVEVGRPGIALPLMIAAHMPAPSTPDAMILVCGPGAMVKELSGPKIFKKGKAPQQGPLLGVLKKLGYSETTVTKV
jgi:hypothetical protein